MDTPPAVLAEVTTPRASVTGTTGARVKQVRALERGLDVLLALREAPGHGVSLNALHARLGLPKATLLRLLQTLSAKGLVWRRLADGAWLPSLRHALARPEDALVSLAEIASPLLVELSSKVVWPSVIAVPRYDHMDIIETNSPMTRFDFAHLGPVGAKLSYLHTATGRAYLAACGDVEREAIIARLRPIDADEEGMRMLHAIIADTRARGYSNREPHHPWADRNRQTVLRDGKSSMAVPVCLPGNGTGWGGRGQPIAALNITWPTRRARVEEVAAQHLQALQAIASRIGAAALAEGFTR
ncbi:helix-turn-helix domain-containing protein [Novosphingobium sp. FSY-8]|uniref:Helix-turn-helix domain-containing protein n=2 Tax=Novosphingobium ovatum TaxID=1908523 RepID=A0ABW9XDT4_9SPHN|nr:helix-turn-helix domain-containing protein [Novosphingobium ovatum]